MDIPEYELRHKQRGTVSEKNIAKEGGDSRFGELICPWRKEKVID